MPQQNKIILFAFVLLIALAVFMKTRQTGQTAKATTENEIMTADTLIPRGHVLVPVQLENIQAISGLIGQFGIIDLYGGVSGQNSVLLAARAKILRAPLNPDQYAVMVTEARSKIIMQAQGPFWGVVQNRFPAAKKIAAPPPTKDKSKKSYTAKEVEIEYYQGDNL